ncbi:formate dehydrogenase [Corynebacterium phocae]|uniref:Sulfur carrier protein FdhD n=1 Tax=Corynebacterium phocae TaxID=161895 RepID=A0A1L7D511_9CORY|nr:formate dehydrogenase accessory sulfurtransferase FdhD [Corynebacterium phocae]APT93228.1 formate dehydrogenase [Corynebacterium phocae]KAA8721545.1 formate dehydrogenase accessory sulfurtransferase FdhD [Corynebacterium phocae]
MAGRKNATFAVTKVHFPGGPEARPSVDTRADTVAGEQPLEIRSGGTTITTTMRTPGHDIELAHGFLYSESHIRQAADITEARYCAGATVDGKNTYNLLDVDFARTGVISASDLRLTVTNSACGVCGTSSIEALEKKRPYPIPEIPVDPQLVVGLPGKLREHQREFRRTGGIHAAGAFTLDGELVVAREDIGRHNAADKVIGHLLLEGRLPADDLVLVMSSRASFELVQKAAMAGFGMLVTVSAASSLAVETARATGMALVGFAREDRFNLYSGQLKD